MPVLITPSSHTATLITTTPATNPLDVLPVTNSSKPKPTTILQSSITPHHLSTTPILPSNNGFISAIIHSYSTHHHLTIRPEDIWFAILTQLSIYINANSSSLRSKFVSHTDKKTLEIVCGDGGGGRFKFDFRRFANDMSVFLQENIIDADLREWIIPDFSTTTDQDVVVASILMMGSLQSYFNYVCALRCGLPSVTLLGEKEDYEMILKRLDWLDTLGEETRVWAGLLRPVLKRMVRSFEEPRCKEVVGFWQRVMDAKRQMSAATRYTGWVVAFCFWDKDGKCLYIGVDGKGVTYKENGVFGEVASLIPGRRARHKELRLSLDGVRYHSVSADDIPPGWCNVPVLIDDNGVLVDTEMLAGSVGIAMSSSGLKSESGKTGLDTMQSESGWWIYEI